MAKIVSKQKVLEYANEFKVRVVKLSCLEGIKIKQIAQGLDLHPFMISRWRKEFRDGTLVADSSRRVRMANDKPSPTPKQLAENTKLRKEIARLKKENNALKKFQRYLADQKQNDSDT